MVINRYLNVFVNQKNPIVSKLKVKICRSQSSTNDWYIPQSKLSIQLPDLINSCENLSKLKKNLNKPRRRIRFIPTMVQIPPSIFDREFDTFQSNEMTVINHESELNKSFQSVKFHLIFQKFHHSRNLYSKILHLI